ncbi:MAG: PilZ domain-containing protein [Lachnospiraceae bacterium]|nr:PilZ domain-containing protein [Lachnospiraceae bacterium]
MLINEIAKGSSIELKVMIGNNTLEFNTEVVEIDDKQYLKAIEKLTSGYLYLIVRAIMKEDKIISFPASGPAYRLMVVNKEDDKAYEWITIQIRQIKLKDGSAYHLFLTNKDVKEVNRRNRYRVWLGVDGIVQIGFNKMTFDVIVKDISSTGVSFILRNDLLKGKTISADTNTMIALTFYEEKTETNFRLTATIVRCEAIDENRTLYGCKFASEHRGISKYVNEKQIEKMRLGKCEKNF